MPTSTAGSWIKGIVPLRKGTPPFPSSQDGFTLVELSLVVLLIGLFSLLTVPIFAGWGEGSLQSSARRLAGTVKYLYNESALQKKEFRLVFDLDKGAYRASVLEAGGRLEDVAGTGRLRQLRGDVRFQDVAVAGRGKFTSGEVTTVIHPVGWLEETIVHLKDGDGRTLTLRLMPFTGATEIYEGYREFEKRL
jgi:general secretion pathway protein H